MGVQCAVVERKRKLNTFGARERASAVSPLKSEHSEPAKDASAVGPLKSERSKPAKDRSAARPLKMGAQRAR